MSFSFVCALMLTTRPLAGFYYWRTCYLTGPRKGRLAHRRLYPIPLRPLLLASLDLGIARMRLPRALDVLATRRTELDARGSSTAAFARHSLAVSRRTQLEP